MAQRCGTKRIFGDRGFLDIIVVKPFAKLRRFYNFLITLLKISGSRIQSKTLLPRLGFQPLRESPL
jgi:hypothetical protein